MRLFAQVLRRGDNPDVAYGAHRSLQSAITSHLVATRLAWEPAQADGTRVCNGTVQADNVRRHFTCAADPKDAAGP